MYIYIYIYNNNKKGGHEFENERSDMSEVLEGEEGKGEMISLFIITSKI